MNYIQGSGITSAGILRERPPGLQCVVVCCHKEVQTKKTFWGIFKDASSGLSDKRMFSMIIDIQLILKRRGSRGGPDEVGFGCRSKQVVGLNALSSTVSHGCKSPGIKVSAG